MTTEQDVLVDDEGNIIQQQAEEPPVADEPKSEEASTDERPLTTASDEDDEDDDPSQTDDDPERKALRERRREEKRRRRLNHREKEDQLRRELAARDELLAQQQARLDAIERRNTGSEVAQIETAYKRSVEEYNQYKQLVQQATDAADGKTMSEAMERMIESRRRAEQLADLHKRYTQQRSQPQPQPLDPRIKTHAEAWMTRNDWYDPQGRDMDSRVTLTIDQAMAEEGWNPTTAEYWEELETRVKKFLPHRQKSGYNKPTGTPRSVVGGSGRDSSAASTGYRLSAERVQAIKDAGKWDDPKERADMIQRYRNYDKQQTQG